MNFGKSSSIPGTLCDKIHSVYVCAIPGLVRLPVTILRENTAPLVLTETKVPEKDARAYLEQTLLDALYEKIGADGEVISKHFTQSKSGDTLTVTLRCECEQEIALSRPCDVPNIPAEEGNAND